MLSLMSSAKYLGINVDLQGKAVLVTEPTRHSKPLRAKMTECLFEEMEIGAVYLSKSAVLSAFAVGKSSACVIDIGASGMSFAPIQEGFTLQKNLSEFPVGGDLMDDICSSMLASRKCSVTPPFACRSSKSSLPCCPIEDVHPSYLTQSRRCVVRCLKEFHCRCSEDAFDVTSAVTSAWNSSPTDMSMPSQSYELPDGVVVNNVDRIGVAVSELLFEPETFLMNLQSSCDIEYLNSTRNLDFVPVLKTFPGITKALMLCLNSCSIDIRRDVINSLILTGGVSTIPGFPEKLTKNLQGIGTIGKFKFVAPSSVAERRYGPWVGGSILSSLSTFQQMWMSKAEYEEHGVALLERKCRQ